MSAIFKLMKHLAILQMVNLPAGGEGLSWIASHDPGKLQLIPGLQPASIAAAAAGDQQALAYMRFTAQHRTEYPSDCALNDIDTACLRAAELSSSEISAGPHYDYWAYLVESNPPVHTVLRARQLHTITQMEEAVRQGELAALMWLRAICPFWRLDDYDCVDFMCTAAGHGHLDILKYLHSENDLGFWYDGIIAAAVPHLDCLKWLLLTDTPEGPCPYSSDLLSKIARHHGLPGLERIDEHWGLHEGCWNRNILKIAVEKGDQPMAEWLRAQNPPCPWDATVCRAAVQCKDISMLSWLRSQDPPCPWDEWLTEKAAAGSNLQMLQWLRAQEPPCPWSPRTCAAAVMAGQLDILIWLRSQDPPCPWDATCAMNAARRPDLKLLMWIHENLGLQQASTKLECIRIAAGEGNLTMLKWLSSCGTPLTGKLYIAAAQGNRIHILRFLHDCKVARPQALHVISQQWSDLHRIRLPVLMFLSDIGVQLNETDRRKVRRARKVWCLFYGLVRWWRRAILDPSREVYLAFDSLAEDRSGQLLLTRLS